MIIKDQISAQVEDQAWKKNSLFDLKKQLPLPKQTQGEIVKIIKQSNDVIKNLNDRQSKIMIQKHDARLISENTYSTSKVLTRQNISEDAYLSMSIMHDIATFIFTMTKNLIQIQTEIDPTTLQLVSINGKKVVDIVTLILSTSNIWSQFSYVVDMYDDQIQREMELGAFVHSLFKKILHTAQKISFAVSVTQFKSAVFNEKILKQTSLQQISVIQDDALKFYKQKNQSSKATFSITKFYRAKFAQLLKQRRQMYSKRQRPKFWSKIQRQPSKLNDVIMNNLDSQLENITKKNYMQQKDIYKLIFDQGESGAQAIRNKSYVKKSKIKDKSSEIKEI